MKMLYLKKKKINGINTLISTFYYSKKIAVAICHICIYTPVMHLLINIIILT